MKITCPPPTENVSETPDKGIHADIIVHIFAHLHLGLHAEGNKLDKN